MSSRAKKKTLKIDKCSSDNLTFWQFPITEFFFKLSNETQRKYKTKTTTRYLGIRKMQIPSTQTKRVSKNCF